MQAIFPRDDRHLLPPDEMGVLDHCGPWVIVQGRYGPKALDDDNQEPADWRVYRAGLGLKGTILSCHCLLDAGMLYTVDDTNESRCIDHMEEALALEEDSCR